jgi:dTMP kinase
VARGRFITFEGGEGTGKSTQARVLAERLRARGLEVVATREPGGSAGAEALRRLLLEGEGDRWSPLAEALLMNAARADHLDRLIRPALASGAWVVCDRFADSTRAYQGAGGGVDAQFLRELEQVVAGDATPDLTLILDLDPELGLQRAQGRDLFDRFEARTLAFHERLRQAFLAIAAAEPDRCVVIDASRTPNDVSQSVWAAVQTRVLEPA